MLKSWIFSTYLKNNEDLKRLKIQYFFPKILSAFLTENLAQKLKSGGAALTSSWQVSFCNPQRLTISTFISEPSTGADEEHERNYFKA